jgi:sialic acid synthase SpsE
MNIWQKIQKGVFVIAEAGKNFIQSQEEKSVAEYLENAKKLVDEAAEAGADAIKFQTHNVEDEQLNINVTSPHFKGSDRYSWVKRNTEATPVDRFWKPLKEHCDKKGIIFFSTPMSRGAAKILNEQVGVDLWKIGSGDILDFVMLDYLRGTGKPIIISSGMSTLEEVEKAVGFLQENKETKKQINKEIGNLRNDKIALLHCVSKYPCPPEELRLRTMDLYKKKFNVPIGFSDHSIGIESALVAVAMGAKIVEKHFSLSRDLWGSDHKVSMTPDELRAMIAGIRKIENDPGERVRILGTDFAQKTMAEEGKVLQEGEAVFRPLFRKSLMAGRDISAGETLTPDALYAMRPQMYAGGLPSEEYPNIIGRKAKIKIRQFQPITTEVLS